MKNIKALLVGSLYAGAAYNFGAFVITDKLTHGIWTAILCTIGAYLEVKEAIEEVHNTAKQLEEAIEEVHNTAEQIKEAIEEVHNTGEQIIEAIDSQE